MLFNRLFFPVVLSAFVIFPFSNTNSKYNHGYPAAYPTKSPNRNEADNPETPRCAFVNPYAVEYELNPVIYGSCTATISNPGAGITLGDREGPAECEDFTERQTDDARPQLFQSPLVLGYAEEQERYEPAFPPISVHLDAIVPDTASPTPDARSRTSEESNVPVFQCSRCDASFARRGELKYILSSPDHPTKPALTYVPGDTRTGNTTYASNAQHATNASASKQI